MKENLQNALLKLQAQRGQLAKQVEAVDKEIEKVSFSLEVLNQKEQEDAAEASNDDE